jgi:uncharacterized SAM-binding protein YcdF (DUF218 family)
MKRGRGLAVVLIGLVGLVGALALLHRPLLRLVAQVLVAEDRLEPSDAIVVVAGGTPWREAKAAQLFRQGWAPRVVISRPDRVSSIRELNTLGVRPLDLQGESRVALEKYGVPPDRIIALRTSARTTEPELGLVHRAALAAGYARVILVTSPHHTRRVKLIWSRESRNNHVSGIVVAAAREDFTMEDWWKQRRAAEALLHEYLGITAILLGVSQFMR